MDASIRTLVVWEGDGDPAEALAEAGIGVERVPTAAACLDRLGGADCVVVGRRVPAGEGWAGVAGRSPGGDETAERPPEGNEVGRPPDGNGEGDGDEKEDEDGDEERDGHGGTVEGLAVVSAVRAASPGTAVVVLDEDGGVLLGDAVDPAGSTPAREAVLDRVRGALSGRTRSVWPGLEAVEDPAFVVTVEGHVLGCNRAAADLFGFPVGEPGSREDAGVQGRSRPDDAPGRDPSGDGGPGERAPGGSAGDSDVVGGSASALDRLPDATDGDGGEGASFRDRVRRVARTGEGAAFRARLPDRDARYEFELSPVGTGGDGGDLGGDAGGDGDGSGSRDRAIPGVGVLVRKVAGGSAHEGERRPHEAVLEAVADPVFALDGEATLTFVNGAFVEVTGYPRESLVGSSLHIVVGQDDVEAVRERIEELRSGAGGVDTIEIEVVTRRGDRIAVESHFGLLGDGEDLGVAVGALRDVTDRESREEELGQYETIAEALADPVYATDADGYLTFVNPAFEESLGLPVEEVAERKVHFSEFVAEEDVQRILDEIRGMLTAGERPPHRRSLEITAVTDDGRRMPAEDGLALLPFEEEFRGVAGVLRDLSERKRRQQRLEVMNRVLRHNLRTRANVIMGRADLISREADDPEIAESARRIYESTDQLVTMGNRVRSLQESLGDDRGEVAAVDLASLVESTVEEFREDHPGATIDTHLPASERVQAGPAVRRAVENVVENAIEHSDTDEPEVDVWMVNAPRDGWVDLHVEDAGPGIPDHEREIVTGEEDISPLQHGSGLGLWVTRWVVRAFEGEIEIEDNDPEGTLVTLRFKRADGEEG